MCSFAWLPPSFDASARDDVFRTPGRGGSTHTHNPSFRPRQMSRKLGEPLKQKRGNTWAGIDDDLNLEDSTSWDYGSKPRPCQGRSSRVVAPGRAAPFVELAGMLTENRREAGLLDVLWRLMAVAKPEVEVFKRLKANRPNSGARSAERRASRGRRPWPSFASLTVADLGRAGR